MSIAYSTLPRILSAALAAIPMLTSATAQAEPGAHLHGVAELTVALEGHELEIMFISPAINVVGFEHEASSPHRVAVVTAAETSLRDGTGLFSFTGTDCELRNAEVDMSAVLAHGTGGDAAHSDHKSIEHQNDKGESHTDISARYQYSCADGADVETLRVGSGGLPFGLEKINVMWVSARSQSATVLTQDNRLIEFN